MDLVDDESAILVCVRVDDVSVERRSDSVVVIPDGLVGDTISRGDDGSSSGVGDPFEAIGRSTEEVSEVLLSPDHVLLGDVSLDPLSDGVVTVERFGKCTIGLNTEISGDVKDLRISNS